MFFSGILGMNARNLNFIKKYNDKTAILLADNKLQTKKYFSKIGVPFAKTFCEIPNAEALKIFSFASIAAESFVIKPNKGSKGKGIVIFERQGEDLFSEGKHWEEEDIFRHMRDILDGAYSMNGFQDSIIIEEKLLPHHDFQDFCSYGLSDIRIIVFNYVPVAAMVRIPTLVSAGKANLDQGGVGMGIDIGSGKITSMQYAGKIYTHDFPDVFGDLFLKKIPHWEHILELSSHIQGFVDLGYLALDWVIARDGPKLLEINARAGLEIQNVTGIPLRARLERIQNMKIVDSKKGISIAKSLFSTDNHIVVDTSNSLYLSQLGTLHATHNKKKYHIPLSVTVDTHSITSKFSQDIVTYFHNKPTLLSLDASTLSFQNLSGEKLEDPTLSAQVVLGTKDIQNYVIKPIHHYQAVEKYFNPTLLSPDVKQIDIDLNELGKYLNVSYHLEPLNMLEEKEKFIQAQGKYNPIFSYKFPDSTRLLWIEQKLHSIQKDLQKGNFEKRIFQLFEEKMTELFCKLSLLKGYVEQDFKKIDKYQKRLYGEIQQKHLDLAEQKLREQKKLPKKSQLLGKLLSQEDIILRIQEKLLMYGLPETEIVLREDMTSRISVTTGQFARINLKQGLKIYEKELDAVLAHELGVHLRRFTNGMKSGLRILKHGTGFYLEDEEGVAIYNSLRYLPPDYEKNDMYIKYALASQAYKYSFQDLAERISDIYGERSLDAQFLGALRLKKGIRDTSLFGEKGLAYIKDIIYLNGYMKVKKWVEEGGYLENLMVGKIKIQDIENFTD